MGSKSKDLGRLVDFVESDLRFRPDIAAFDLIQRIAQKLRIMREAAGMTQNELAALLNITQGRVSQIESGSMEYAPNLETIVRYASACGRSLEIDFSERDKRKAAAAA